LGRLAGTGRLLPNPHVLIQPYITREALASSRIEGTQASLSGVFDAQARNTPEGPIREVTNYIRALEHGMVRLDALPVSRRLLCEVHEVLLSDVRGRERLPGEVRRAQNWIGSPDNRPETAVFVPPAVDDMQRAFDDFERFLHEETSIPPLVKIALVHYQFETIHPFLDGNAGWVVCSSRSCWSNSSCSRSRCCTSAPTSSTTAASTTTVSRPSASGVNFASGWCSSSPVSQNWPTMPSIALSDWSIFERATVNG